MSEVLMIIAQTQFRDEEYAEPKAILESHGHEVTTASRLPGECTGKLGMKVEAELGLSDISAAAYDAVVFVGGAGASDYFDQPAVHRIAIDAAESGAVLGAICIAPSILAHAGLLRGKKATAFPSQEGDLVLHEAVFTNTPVQVDGRIVTANGPESATEFGQRLVAMLES